jgi:nitrite reductase/ring-hydroxylating ferredoxin subunit
MIKIFSSLEEASNSIPVGSLRLLIIDGKKISMAHTEDGFYAFENECPHQNEPLHKGTLTAFNEVVCRLHHYRFNLQTGMEANNQCKSMNSYAIIVKDSGIFIDL